MIAELQVNACLFVTQRMKQFHVAHAQSLRVCRFETTSICHFLLWCRFHGFSLQSGLKSPTSQKIARSSFVKAQEVVASLRASILSQGQCD